MSKNDIFYTNESPEMINAFQQARNTFKYFWREVSWDYRRIISMLDIACVKSIFCQEDESGEMVKEYMWLNDIQFDGITISGVLANNPESLTNIKLGDYVEIELDKINDWMFAINSQMYGGFTIQVIRSEMTEQERAGHDSLLGLSVSDKNEVFLVYQQEEHPENLQDHPMSINMQKELSRFLKEYPDEVNKKDEFGYTMLHREAIAGNKPCIEILLENGADINAVTNNGYKAVDFARKLKWEHLIEIL